VKTTTTSADHTRALAAAIGAVLDAGDVVVLIGEMGAGKTTFVQGLARGLGVEDVVTSPTFTIVHEYDGRLPLVHVDVYRLLRVQELHDLGLEDYLESGRVVVVEWGDVVDRALPPERLVVELGVGGADDERTVVIDAVGPRWQARSAALETATRGGEHA
jgi:tRNA threonylcarbamoyladenosine biosynthesis protein TsaE